MITTFPEHSSSSGQEISSRQLGEAPGSNNAPVRQLTCSDIHHLHLALPPEPRTKSWKLRRRPSIRAHRVHPSTLPFSHSTLPRKPRTRLSSAACQAGGERTGTKRSAPNEYVACFRITGHLLRVEGGTWTSVPQEWLTAERTTVTPVSLATFPHSRSSRHRVVLQVYEVPAVCSDLDERLTLA